VRPESFVEINNFYTATVYEKGAELIGMLKSLVGDQAYTKALNLYFDRHDGDAATIEDWLRVFEDVTGRDLAQFKLWYSQAGTPRLKVSEDWDDGISGATQEGSQGHPDQGRTAEPERRRGGAHADAGNDPEKAKLPLRRAGQQTHPVNPARLFGARDP
jgi:aminopeptidase N